MTQPGGTPEFWHDLRVLAEGNARGIPGGDPDFPSRTRIPDGGSIVGTAHTAPARCIPDLTTLSGDLAAHAVRLGIPVEDLIRARTPRGGGSSLLSIIHAAYERLRR